MVFIMLDVSGQSSSCAAADQRRFCDRRVASRDRLRVRGAECGGDLPHIDLVNCVSMFRHFGSANPDKGLRCKKRN